MTPELLTAVGERIKIGRSQTEIVSELVAAGYAPEVAHAAYQAAFSAPSSLTSDVANYAPAYVSGDAVESQEYESSAPYATAASSSLIGLGRSFFIRLDS